MCLNVIYGDTHVPLPSPILFCLLFVCFTLLLTHVVMGFPKFDSLHGFKTFVILGKNFMDGTLHINCQRPIYILVLLSIYPSPPL